MEQKTPPNLLDIIKRAQTWAVPSDPATFDANDWNQAREDIAAMLQFYLDTRAVAMVLIQYAPLTIRPDTSGLTPAQCVLMLSMSIDSIAQKEAAKGATQ